MTKSELPTPLLPPPSMTLPSGSSAAVWLNRGAASRVLSCVVYSVAIDGAGGVATGGAGVAVGGAAVGVGVSGNAVGSHSGAADANVGVGGMAVAVAVGAGGVAVGGAAVAVAGTAAAVGTGVGASAGASPHAILSATPPTTSDVSARIAYFLASL